MAIGLIMACTAPVMREGPSVNRNSHALSLTISSVFMFSGVATYSPVTIRAETLAPVGWQELVHMAESNASSELWSLLKRSDEKWITERAYENPKFVEDLVRDVALSLNADERIGRYLVEVENHESIHNHSAYARIERD